MGAARFHNLNQFTCLFSLIRVIERDSLILILVPSATLNLTEYISDAVRQC